jgi:hypothetical protein
MELKDLKPNDLVSFRFGGDLHKGIFSHVSSRGNPVFVFTDMGYENQCFDKTLFNLVDLVSRPAITDNYEYIKECIADNKIRELELQIELREEQIERLRKGDFVPSFDDVFNFIDPYD